jgi:hypothetical protein
VRHRVLRLGMDLGVGDREHLLRVADITGAFFSRMKWSSTTRTAQMLERTSPPMPISVVAEATSRWWFAISRA